LDQETLKNTASQRVSKGHYSLLESSGLEQTVHEELYIRMLYARPIVPFGKDIGFLPGEKDQKVRPYMQVPRYDRINQTSQQEKEGIKRIK